MAGIKSGTAYVNLQLGAVTALRRDMATAATAAAAAAGAKAGRKLGDSVTASARGPLASLGQVVATSLSGVYAATQKVRAGLRAFSQEVGMLAYQFQFAGLMATAAFTAPVVGLGVLGAAIGVKFAMQIEDATSALKALLPAGYDVAALVKRLQQMAIASPVFDSATVVTFTQKMVAAGVEIGKTERFLKAFGNIAVTAAVPMDKMTLALEAVSQMAGKGKVQMEELRQQLGDALPGAMKIAADGLGVTQKRLFEMVSAGEVTADMLMDAFIRVGESKTYLEGAANGANTLRSKWNAMVETIQATLGGAVLRNMDKLKKAFDDAQPHVQVVIDYMVDRTPAAVELLGKIVGKIKDLKDSYDKLNPSQKEWVDRLAKAAVIAGPLLLVLGAFGTAVGALAAAFAFLTSPVGLVVVGVLAFAAACVAGWKWVKKFWQESETLRGTVDKIVSAFEDRLLPTLKKLTGRVKDEVLGAWDQLRQTWNDVSKDCEGLTEVLRALGVAVGIAAALVVGLAIGVVTGVLGFLGPAIRGVASFVSGVIKIVTGFVNLIHDIMYGNWSDLAGDLRMIWDGLWDAIVGTLFNFSRAGLALISGFIEGVVGFFQMLYDILVGHSIVPDMVNEIINWFVSLKDRAVDFVMGLVDSVNAQFGYMKDAVVGLVGSLVDQAVGLFWKVVGAFSSIASAAGEHVSRALGYVKDLPGKILSAVSGFGSVLYQAGRDLIQGLINGISNMTGAVLAKAASLAESVRSTIASKMKIGSPSKVMYRLGAWVGSGFALGIGSMASTVAAAAAELTSSIVSPAFTAPGDIPAGKAPESRGATLYIENYTAPKDGSPNDVAEAFAWINRTRGWA